jgi:hypothetical protein
MFKREILQRMYSWDASHVTESCKGPINGVRDVIDQTQEKVFHPISTHLEVFFNPLLDVWIADETLFLVSDLLIT